MRIRGQKKMSEFQVVPSNENVSADIVKSASSAALASIPPESQTLLQRMFADPRILEKQERITLLSDLRACVAHYPEVSELRVLLGMALCVNLEVQAAMDELGEAVALDPSSFITHLKIGELWMRLRVLNKAEDHTRQAAKLARNLAQSQLARQQAATIRSMQQKGIDRNGYRTPWLSLARLRRLWPRKRSDELATAEIR
jgi:hypothetical protein